jgi:hypothetical protein
MQTTPDCSPQSADFEFSCPHCSQPLKCSTEIIGASTNCPVCGGAVTIPAPADTAQPLPENPAGDQVEHWMVDVRVLLPRTPPTYFKILVEVPKGLVSAQNVTAPEPVFQVVTHAIKAKYPQSPVTPLTVHSADAEAMKRRFDDPDYSESSCKVWLLGRRGATH